MMLTSKGGLIGKIPDKKIFAKRNVYSISDKMESFYKYLKIKPKKGDSKILLYGSYNFAIQPYFGDLDTINIVHYATNKKKAVEEAVKDIQKIISKLNDNNLGRFFTDMKCGLYKDGEAIHWTAQEILDGKREGNKKDFNGHVGNKTLKQAIQQVSLCKIDMIAPYNNRYIEITVVYQFSCLDGMINYVLPARDQLLKSLNDDIIKQLKKEKYFKIIKRLYSAASIKGDVESAQNLYPLLTSNISRLSMINGDLKTIELLLQLKKNINTNIIKVELERIKEMLGNIQDINFYGKLDEIYYLLDMSYIDMMRDKNSNDEDKYEDALNKLENVTNYLGKITNNETLDYLKENNINISFLNGAIKEYI